MKLRPTRTHTRIACALVALSNAAAAAEAPPTAADRVAATPCLYEYRLWVFNGSRGSFQVPSQFTPEQCTRAAAVHQQLEAERIAEIEAERAMADQAASAAAAREKAARDIALKPLPSPSAPPAAEGPPRPRSSKPRPSPKPAPQLPGVTLGMTAEQVRTTTHWGTPYTVRRLHNASGRWEFWDYGGGNKLIFRDGILVEVHN